jgi:tetratricopeptide (TPR) repeat protein
MFFKVFDRPDFPLNEVELQARRRKQRRVAIIGIVILIILSVTYVSTRPILNMVRAWQARRHAQKAYALIDQEKWNEAQSEASAAYQLRASEPEAIRAVARLLSRDGQADGLRFWKELEAKSKLTRIDLRDEANVALKSDELNVADEAIKELLGDRDGGPKPADWLLAAKLALRVQDLDRATVQVRKIFASHSASDLELLRGIVVLDDIQQTTGTKDQTEVLARFARLAHGKERVALDALVGLAQHILGATSPWPNPSGMSVGDIIQAIDAHPLSKPQHNLLAVDLKIHEHPEQRDTLVQSAIAQWKGGDNATLFALAGWLNQRGEYQRELDTIPRQRAMQTRELFFQHVDALGALGRWDQIRRLIESEQFPLDPVGEHMYLARCFAQQNQSNGAENNWRRALEAAAGDFGKLMVLGDYAEKNGAYAIAGAAFEAAIAVSPKSRQAQQGRLRVAYMNRDTNTIHAILVELLKLWPNDPTLQNDEAYARLLLLPAGAANNEELIDIEHLAEKLVQREPASLPHRNLLALALLKQNRPAEAQFRELIKLDEKILGPEHPDTLDNRANLAVALNNQGNYAEAELQLRELIKLDEKVLGPDHPQTLGSRSNLASTLTAEGKYAEAEAESRAILTIAEKTMGPEDSNTLITRNDLAWTLDLAGKFSEAEQEIRPALSIMSRLYGTTNVVTLNSRDTLGEALRGQRKFAEAEAEFRAALAGLESRIGVGNGGTLDVAYRLARCLKDENKLAEAKQLAERAVEGARTKLGADHPDTKKYEKLLIEVEAKK